MNMITKKDRYYVYVPKIIPTEHQLDRKTVLKENKGHPVAPSEYPEEKILIKRLSLTDLEFNAWFEKDEDILEGGITKEEEELSTSRRKILNC